MSCTSFEPRCDERDLSASSSSNCRAPADEEEEDRLSTAAPSICDEVEAEATTRWADVADAQKRWADLYDSDEEDLKCVPLQSKKTRWADLADEEDAFDLKTGDVASGSKDESPHSWKVNGSSWGSGRDNSRGAWMWHSEASSSSHAAGTWGQQMQWRPRHDRGNYSKWEDWGWYERPKGKGKGKSKGKGEGKSAKTSAKCQCQFMIGIEEEAKFHVCRRLLGPQGKNMKDIAQQTGAKLRLRGQGSKFLEGPEQKESSDPLMLCVSAPDHWSYQEAKRLISSLLEDIYAQYHHHQQSEGETPLTLRVNMHEGPRPGSF